MKCKMTLKIYFPFSHLKIFLKNLSAVSGEHGERVHKDIAKIDNKYQSCQNSLMLSDYYWTQQLDVLGTEYKQNQQQNTLGPAELNQHIGNIIR